MQCGTLLCPENVNVKTDIFFCNRSFKIRPVCVLNWPLGHGPFFSTLNPNSLNSFLDFHTFSRSFLWLKTAKKLSSVKIFPFFCLGPRPNAHTSWLRPSHRGIRDDRISMVWTFEGRRGKVKNFKPIRVELVEPVEKEAAQMLWNAQKLHLCGNQSIWTIHHLVSTLPDLFLRPVWQM